MILFFLGLFVIFEYLIILLVSIRFFFIGMGIFVSMG